MTAHLPSLPECAQWLCGPPREEARGLLACPASGAGVLPNPLEKLRSLGAPTSPLRPVASAHPCLPLPSAPADLTTVQNILGTGSLTHYSSLEPLSLVPCTEELFTKCLLTCLFPVHRAPWAASLFAALLGWPRPRARSRAPGAPPLAEQVPFPDPVTICSAPF